MMNIFFNNLNYLGSYENDYCTYIVLSEKQILMIFLDLLRSYEDDVVEKDEWEEEDLYEHLISYLRSRIEDFLLRHKADGIFVIAKKENHTKIENGDDFLDFLSSHVFKKQDFINEIVQLWLKGDRITT